MKSTGNVYWNKHFAPAFIAGLIVSIIAYFIELSPGNLVLIASVGASAAILTHPRFKQTANLRVTLLSYIITSVISMGVILLNLNIHLKIFLIIFLVAGVLSIFEAFHPPAISASLSFLLLETQIINFLWLLLAILLLLTSVRIFTLMGQKNFNLKDILKELKTKKK